MSGDALAAFSTSADAEPTLAQMRARFRADKAEALARFGAARPTVVAALRLLHGLSAQVDAALGELWAQSALPAGAARLPAAAGTTAPLATAS